MSSNAIAPRPIDGKEVMPTLGCTLPPLALNQLTSVSAVLTLVSISPQSNPGTEEVLNFKLSPRCPRNSSTIYRMVLS